LLGPPSLELSRDPLRRSRPSSQERSTSPLGQTGHQQLSSLNRPSSRQGSTPEVRACTAPPPCCVTQSIHPGCRFQCSPTASTTFSREVNHVGKNTNDHRRCSPGSQPEHTHTNGVELTMHSMESEFCAAHDNRCFLVFSCLLFRLHRF
jgi:hypothetical protein